MHGQNHIKVDVKVGGTLGNHLNVRRLTSELDRYQWSGLLCGCFNHFARLGGSQSRSLRTSGEDRNVPRRSGMADTFTAWNLCGSRQQSCLSRIAEQLAALFRVGDGLLNFTFISK